MKTYIVKFKLTHESFGGYEHSDGYQDIKVTAGNEELAREKARKIIKKKTNLEARLISIRYE